MLLPYRVVIALALLLKNDDEEDGMYILHSHYNHSSMAVHRDHIGGDR